MGGRGRHVLVRHVRVLLHAHEREGGDGGPHAHVHAALHANG